MRKKTDNSHQIFKGYEDYIGNKKINKDKLDKVCGDNVKKICCEKDEVNKKNHIEKFIKNLNKKKRELQSNKIFLWRKVSKCFINLSVSKI